MNESGGTRNDVQQIPLILMAKLNIIIIFALWNRLAAADKQIGDVVYIKTIINVAITHSPDNSSD